jgi:hypothetical protein
VIYFVNTESNLSSKVATILVLSKCNGSCEVVEIIDEDDVDDDDDEEVNDDDDEVVDFEVTCFREASEN